MPLSSNVHDYLAGISPPGELTSMIHLIGSIWDLSEAKNSLYFRGSFSRSHRRHLPLDVDMYYVLNEDDSSLPSTEDVCIELHEQYPNLPRLDLSIFTRADLLNPEIRQMTRLILMHDGTFICGENLLPVIPPVAFTQRNAEIIWFKQTEIVAKKLRGARTINDRTIDDGLLTYFYTSIAKSVLRLVMHVFMLSDAVFTRDVKQCAAYIQTDCPHLSPAVEVMLGQLNSKEHSASEFLASANLLFDSLKWTPNRLPLHLSSGQFEKSLRG